MEGCDIHYIVTKLVGAIDPVGETNEDNARFENLKVLTELVEDLLTDINCVYHYINRHEYSMKRAGEYADKFLLRIIEEYSEAD